MIAKYNSNGLVNNPVSTCSLNYKNDEDLPFQRKIADPEVNKRELITIGANVLGAFSQQDAVYTTILFESF